MLIKEEILAVKEAAKQFAEQRLLPSVIERDENQKFPLEEVREMGAMGLMGMMVSERYGGSAMGALAYVTAMEEIAKVDASAAVIMSVNNSLVCWVLETYGTEEQKEKFLTPLATGTLHGAFALSEPEAGSDAASQKTVAKKEGDNYLITGTKNWITNGGTAAVYIVIAQTDNALAHKGISAFVVEAGTEGFTIGPKENKMGIRASDTHSLHFDSVVVPKSQRIGKEGDGFKIALATLDGGRIGIAAQALGIAQGAFDIALQYSTIRETFKKKLIKHQGIAFKLADMHTSIEAARLLVQQAAQLKDKGESYTKAAATAKLFASKVAMEVTVEAVQILGGNGYVKEYHVERMMRDAKITQIYEGTSEIQKLVIARALEKEINKKEK